MNIIFPIGTSCNQKRDYVDVVVERLGIDTAANPTILRAFSERIDNIMEEKEKSYWERY